MIVFGDSLSDIGNLPENPNPLVKTAPKTADDYNATFYIPASNPVNIQPNAYSVSIVDLFHLKHATYKFRNFLKQLSFNQMPQPKIKGGVRFFHSAEWDLFSLADAYQDSLTNSQVIMPSMILRKEAPSLSSDVSVVYAWSNALSGQGCYTTDWQKSPGVCNSNAIYQSLLNYYNDKKRSYNQKIKDIKIPGLLSQVDQLINDVQSKSVLVGHNTVYVIWTGGNDLAHNFDILEHDKSILHKLSALKNLVYTTAWDNYKAMKKLATNRAIQAKQIYLFNMFDVTLTPRVYHWSPLLKRIAKGFIGIYNLGLKTDVAMMRKNYPNVTIELIPIDKWFNQMSAGTNKFAALGFKKHLGAACEMQSADYLSNRTPLDNCKGYLFWNAIHPAFPAEQVIDYLFKKTVAANTDHHTATIINHHTNGSASKKILKSAIDQTVKMRYHL